MIRDTFVDEATIEARSGHGGKGAVAFRREKHVAFGGPNGGDGGRGGDVIVVADRGKRTLLHLRFNRLQAANDGGNGGGAQCTGASGQDCLIVVPVGTQVLAADDGTVLADLTEPDAPVVLLRGGRGGKGNEHFKSATRQAPQFAQPGEPGEARSLKLELKLLADVGLLGMPNVGKSSLIAAVSAARPKIANYPFTTLVPNLGVVAYKDAEPFVVADIPGLVPGAHRGVGLGAQFLRHLERVTLLVHVLTVATDEPGRSPIADFEALNAELSAHRPGLAALPQVVVLNQCDRPDVQEQAEEVGAFVSALGHAYFVISAATGAGTEALLGHLAGLLQQKEG